MALKLSLRGAMAGLLISVISPINAHAQTQDADTAQVVGLFVQSCMKFAGHPTALRSWIAAHHLPPIPEAQALYFRGPMGAGQVFGASTQSGKHAVVSYDSGTCQVVALAGDASAVQRMLLASLRKLGVEVSQTLVRSKPDGSSTQRLFDAVLGSRRWTFSITSQPHSDAPNLAPELHLLVTGG